jgi:Tol biopolymer transport system component
MNTHPMEHLPSMSPRRARRVLTALGATMCLLAAWAEPVKGQGTERVSVGAGGMQALAECTTSSISADGRFVAFRSTALLAGGPFNGVRHILVRDRLNGTTDKASVASGGAQAGSDSNNPVLSADGRYVAFQTHASNLVAGDTNGFTDVFVHDRNTGTTERVSVDTNGVQGNLESFNPSISADGRYVAFQSSSSNLVVGDTNAVTDVFVRDRIAGTTERVSISTSGDQGNGQSEVASLSGDGNLVAFHSLATNLVAGDTNGNYDVFVRNRLAGTTARASVATGGAQANLGGQSPKLSADGRYVVFGSIATNLVAGDTNAFEDVFVHDLLTQATERVSVATGGAQSNSANKSSWISGDGRFVVFTSQSTNLVPVDVNLFDEVFIRDRLAGTTEFASLTDAGAQPNAACVIASVSDDGRYVAFQSLATDLVAGDTNGLTDVFVRDRGPQASPAWTDLGHALAGGAGPPQLAGTGTLVTGSAGSLVLSNAAPSAIAMLFTSLSGNPTPFKGGLLVPVPAIHMLLLGTSPGGSLPLAWGAWPGGLSGLGVHFQYAIQDAGGPHGVSLSNALRGDVP